MAWRIRASVRLKKAYKAYEDLYVDYLKLELQPRITRKANNVLEINQSFLDDTDLNLVSGEPIYFSPTAAKPKA